MAYRTRTYIAADWDSDAFVVETLRKWNEADYLGLHFPDAHQLGEARDSSLNCSIKKSLCNRLARSKTFVLIAGDNTTYVRAGSCQYCHEYSAARNRCRRGHNIDLRSYIEFECDYALRNIQNIVVDNADKRMKQTNVLQNKGVRGTWRKG